MSVHVCLLPSDQFGTVGHGPMLHLVLLLISGVLGSQCCGPLLGRVVVGGKVSSLVGWVWGQCVIPTHTGLQPGRAAVVGLVSEYLWAWDA